MGAQPSRHGKVHLDGPTLPEPTDGVLERELDLGAVEGALARFFVPWQLAAIECLPEGLLRLVPALVRTDAVGRARGEFVDDVLEPEVRVDLVQQVDEGRDLALDHVLGAEDMRVVLYE